MNGHWENTFFKSDNEPVELDRDGVADTAADKVQDNIQGGSNPIRLPHWIVDILFNLLLTDSKTTAAKLYMAYPP